MLITVTCDRAGWEGGEGVFDGCNLTSLSPYLLQSLLQQPGGLHIVAVGSVLNHCWDLLREGWWAGAGYHCVTSSGRYMYVSVFQAVLAPSARRNSNSLCMNYRIAIKFGGFVQKAGFFFFIWRI